MEERLDLIRSLKRKYGNSIEEILSFREKAGEEFDLLSDSEGIAEKLAAELNELDERIYSACCKLTNLRKQCASDFCKNVEHELKSLQISGARFEVSFSV